MTIKRRLHVWEHPSLHPEQQRKAATTPVHIIFEDDEYDYWEVSEFDRALCIGLVFEINPNNLPLYKGEPPVRKEVRYRVSANMFAKVWEEFYEVTVLSEDMLFDQDEQPELGAREQFAQRLAQQPPLERAIPVDLGVDEEETDGDSHTVITPATVPERIDSNTGVNLSYIAKQVSPSTPEPPAETRLDLKSPLMMLEIVPEKGQQPAESTAPLQGHPTTPPASGS